MSTAIAGPSSGQPDNCHLSSLTRATGPNVRPPSVEVAIAISRMLPQKLPPRDVDAPARPEPIAALQQKQHRVRRVFLHPPIGLENGSINILSRRTGFGPVRRRRSARGVIAM